MKPLLVLASLFAAANAGISGISGFGGGGGSGFSGNSAGYSGGGNGAAFSNGGYTGAIAGGFSGGIGGFGGGVANNGGYSGADGAGFGGGGGQIRKFVSVHVGPEEPQITQTKVIRAGGAPDKHVNIIFVKAPSASNQQNTEVILPEAPQQKTLVYVLVKKQESSNNVRVRGPAPTRPSKPEVYFIRYKDSVVTGGGAPGIGGGFGNDVSGAIGGGSPNQAYGPPPSGGVGVNVNNGGY